MGHFGDVTAERLPVGRELGQHSLMFLLSNAGELVDLLPAIGKGLTVAQLGS